MLKITFETASGIPYDIEAEVLEFDPVNGYTMEHCTKINGKDVTDEDGIGVITNVPAYWQITKVEEG